MDCDLSMLYSNPDPCLKFYYDKVLSPEYESHNHSSVLAVFGGDFHWFEAEFNYAYLNLFMNLLNSWSMELFGIQINAGFSTVNEYFDSLKSDEIEFHEYVGDFIPYIET